MDLHVRSGSVDSDGEDIYWELTATAAEEGDEDQRPVVVLSHGAGGSHAVWYQQVPALAAHFRVLTWDSRGFGNSTNRTNSPSAEAAASDLAAVLDHLEIVTAHLVGQSMGGWHNSAFARASGERVRSLTFADTIGGLWTPALRDAFAEFTRRGGLARSGPEVLGRHPALWDGTAERDPAKAFLYQQLGTFHDPPLDRIGATIAFEVAHAEIDALGVPVLFVAGSHDGLFPPAGLAESCALLARGRYVEIGHAGHSPYFEQPDAWNDAVLEFLISVA